MKQFKARKKNRLKGYDYSEERWYFITICTFNRKEIFGQVKRKNMFLNKYGEIAKAIWSEIPKHFENVELDEFIIMPNHIHGIIMHRPVGTGHALSSNNKLSIIIGSFKSAVTRQINQSKGKVFKWQRSFYDHIIRTTDSLQSIRQYIAKNPRTWNDDEHNIKNYSIKGKACLAPTGQF